MIRARRPSETLWAQAHVLMKIPAVVLLQLLCVAVAVEAHPWVPQGLIECRAFCVVLRKEFANEVPSFLRNMAGEIDTRLLDLFACFFLASHLVLERRLSAQELVQQDAQAPNID